MKTRVAVPTKKNLVLYELDPRIKEAYKKFEYEQKKKRSRQTACPQLFANDSNKKDKTTVWDFWGTSKSREEQQPESSNTEAATHTFRYEYGNRSQSSGEG